MTYEVKLCFTVTAWPKDELLTRIRVDTEGCYPAAY